jgi:hypothetical protein
MVMDWSVGSSSSLGVISVVASGVSSAFSSFSVSVFSSSGEASRRSA